MSKKKQSDDEVLKALLDQLSPEALEALLLSKKAEAEPEGPKRSAITNSQVVLDNSEFEKNFRNKCKSDLVFDKEVQREVSDRRDPIQKKKVNCYRCGKEEWVFPSAITAKDENGKTAYACVNCSGKTRT